MVKLADTQDLGSCAEKRAGSSPVIRTKMQTNRIAMRFVFICTRFLHEFFEFTRFYLKFQPLFLLVEGTDESIYSK